MSKKANQQQAAAAIGGGGAVAITTYAAGWASSKYGVPLEVTAPVIGIAFGWLSRLFAKLDPLK